MKFNDLLQEYENKLNYVKRMTTSDALSFYHKTKDYWDGYLKSSFDWFQQMKMLCEDFNPKVRTATEKESTKYRNADGCSSLNGILEYRGEIIPVYNDDYGQQKFAVYLGREISGGSYNFCCEYDFCYEIDYLKDIGHVEGEEHE